MENMASSSQTMPRRRRIHSAESHREFPTSFADLVHHVTTTTTEQPTERRRSWSRRVRAAFWAPSATTSSGESKGADGTSSDLADIQLEYEFVLILRNENAYTQADCKSALNYIGEQQKQIIERLHKAGLEMAVLGGTVHTRNYLCLLLRPTNERMLIEMNRLVLERWFQVGAVGQVPLEIQKVIEQSDIGEDTVAHTSPGLVATATPAERLQTIARIISSSADETVAHPPGAGIALEDNDMNEPIIHDCFPLHNRVVNNILLRKWTVWWKNSAALTDDVRFYFGERVAFYFAFLFKLTKCLLVPALLGVILYMSLRFSYPVHYMRALTAFGFLMSTVFGTLFIKVSIPTLVIITKAQW